MSYPTEILSKTGKKLSDITLQAVTKGEITPEDIKISKENLLLQAEAANKSGRPHLANNFQRAAELVDIPDDLLLEMYGQLRPYRATKSELLQMAKTLQAQYNAPITAKLVSETAEVYERRGILKQ